LPLSKKEPLMSNILEKLQEENTLQNYFSSSLKENAKTQNRLRAHLYNLFVAAEEKKWEEAAILAKATQQIANKAAYEAIVSKAATRNDLAEEPTLYIQDIPDADMPADAIIPNHGENHLAHHPSEEEILGIQESFSLHITLNPKQLAAKEMAMSGKSFALIGAAGTGKTTTQRAVAEALLEDKKLSTTYFKVRQSPEAEAERLSCPSIAFCAFTRRAAANLRKAVHKSDFLAEALPYNIMTIHALLEYEPETYWDYEEDKEKFRFAPKRNASNPLTITHLVIEESSMVGAEDLWQKLYDALPLGVQIIFIGDINQLPPVFGPSVLNYALVQLPVVELTEVYRNQGIVLENAHNILKGNTLVEDHNFQLVRGKNAAKVGQDKTSIALGHMFEQLAEKVDENGFFEYDPADCIILSPWNKQALGTENMNKWIAQFLGKKRNAVVHEVIASFNKLYLAEGDKVMYNKMDGVIERIERNPQYHGKDPQLPGMDLTRFGMRIIGEGTGLDLEEGGDIDYSNFSLEELEKESAKKMAQASHKVTIKMDSGITEIISAVGDFAESVFSLGYALTVHKAQGSEWRKVFIILHADHAVSLYRELFYTAVTRARTKVVIIAKDLVIQKAIKNQRIKGNTIKDKIEYFNSGAINNELNVACTKG